MSMAGSTGQVSLLSTILLLAVLLSVSLIVGAFNLAESFVRRVRKSNIKRRRALLAELGIDEKTEGRKRIVVGLLHPFCHAGGGGERVLYEAIAHHQRSDPDVVCVVYTGDLRAPANNVGESGEADPGVGKEQILERCKARFDITISPTSVAFLPLRSRALVEDGYWRHFTLLGQSAGSIKLGCEAMAGLIPDIFIDTMGYAFTFPVVRAFAPKIPIGAYVHYPTISTDMLRRVEQRAAGHTNDAQVAKSALRSRAKLLYYRLFASIYAWCLRRTDAIVVNGSWTQAHVNSLLLPPAVHSRQRAPTPQEKAREAKIVYPPCDTESMNGFSLERKGRMIVSLAQFRPEKEHAQQLRFLRALFDLRPELQSAQGDDKVQLVMMGSMRNEGDAKRVEALKALTKELKLENHVEFVVNAPYATVLDYLSRASVGLSTMVDEHFGINVVEFMAAGLITLSHASAGPLLDIAIPVSGQPTGFHALDTPSFAQAGSKIFDLSPEEAGEMRKRARGRAVQTFGTESFCKGWKEFVDRLGEKRRVGKIGTGTGTGEREKKE